MFTRSLVIGASFVFAILILGISLLRCSTPNYVFSESEISTDEQRLLLIPSTVDYELQDPDFISPDSVLWGAKALGQKVYFRSIPGGSQRAYYLLYLADSRLSYARDLFREGNPDLGFSVLTKSEKYLEEAVRYARYAHNQGEKVDQLFMKLANSSLAHRAVITGILNIAPQDARPKIIEVENYPKRLYQELTTYLMEYGDKAPINPFDH